MLPVVCLSDSLILQHALPVCAHLSPVVEAAGGRLQGALSTVQVSPTGWVWG